MDLYSCPALSISNCVTVKLTEKNFIMWKCQFESFLSGQELLGFVDGSTLAPARVISVTGTDGSNSIVPNPDFPAWLRSDQVVRAWLLGSLSEDILSVVVGSTTSKEVWDSLSNHFNRVSSSRLFELQRSLQMVSKNNRSMEEYLREVKNLYDQLTSIGSPVSEKMKIFAALNGLGQEYEPIKTSIEGSIDGSHVPLYEDIVPRLTTFDHRLQSYSPGSSVTPHLAFNTERAEFPPAYYNNNNRGRGDSYDRFGSKRGRGFFSTKGRGFHQQITQGSSISSSSENGTRPTCQICGKLGPHALKCWHRFDRSYQDDDLPHTMAALRITDVTDSGNEWYPDTCASAHITNSPHNLHQARPYCGNDSVMVGDGNFLPITHTGSASIASTSGNKEASHPGKQP